MPVGELDEPSVPSPSVVLRDGAPPFVFFAENLFSFESDMPPCSCVGPDQEKSEETRSYDYA